MTDVGTWNRLEADLVAKAIFVITSESGGVRAGMTAAWVTRVSSSPPQMAVAIHRASQTGELIAAGDRYVINVLGEGQAVLAQRFGSSSSRIKDKFKGVRLTTAPQGCPVLSDALGYIECHVAQILDVGDHRLFVGEIVAAERLTQGRPLLYSAALEEKTGG